MMAAHGKETPKSSLSSMLLAASPFLLGDGRTSRREGDAAKQTSRVFAYMVSPMIISGVMGLSLFSQM